MPEQSALRRMLEWLSYLPPLESVARSVALDYLAKMTGDLLKRIQGKTFKPGCNFSNSDVNSQWHNTLQELADVSK